MSGNGLCCFNANYLNPQWTALLHLCADGGKIASNKPLSVVLQEFEASLDANVCAVWDRGCHTERILWRQLNQKFPYLGTATAYRRKCWGAAQRGSGCCSLCTGYTGISTQKKTAWALTCRSGKIWWETGRGRCVGEPTNDKCSSYLLFLYRAFPCFCVSK